MGMLHEYSTNIYLPSGNRVNADVIKKAVDQSDWIKTLGSNDVDWKVAFFSDNLMNIIQNFVPIEYHI